jgi:hypothetical protein
MEGVLRVQGVHLLAILYLILIKGAMPTDFSLGKSSIFAMLSNKN